MTATPAYQRDRFLRGPWFAAQRDADTPTTAHQPPRHPQSLGLDPATLHPPMVLTTFHLGPQFRLGPFLSRLPAVVAIPANGPPAIIGNMVVHPAEEEWQRVAAFSHCARTVRAGGFALVTADGLGGARIPARLLGRDVALTAGPFALARLTGAPLLPLAARWSGRALHVAAGKPIPLGEPAVMASAVTRWFESYLREHPAELSAGCARLLGARAASGSSQRAAARSQRHPWR